MNKHILLGIAALLVLVVAIPIYALLEPARLDLAQRALRQDFLKDGTIVYIENCAVCHGADGEGIGAVPPLANPAFADADPGLLFQTVARATHGTTMAAWHINEGGVLDDHEVNELVTLIQYGDWQQVNAVAENQGFTPTLLNTNTDTTVYMAGEANADDPHRCVACHEEPVIHADRFGLNCARCHTAEEWKPALLLHHTFLLDHGGEGQVSCQTCHVTNYYENNCYTCHDHDVNEMEQVHQSEGIFSFADCTTCHPTGASGEAALLGYGKAGQLRGSSNMDADSAQASPIMEPANK